MYVDHTPDGEGFDTSEYWTVALVDPGYREVHFGVFDFDDVRKAFDSGKIKCLEGQRLELRRIRRFPK